MGFGIIFYYILSTPLPDYHSVLWIASSDRLPLFFGTAIFAIDGILVVLPIENQVRKTLHMNSQINYLYSTYQISQPSYSEIYCFLLQSQLAPFAQK